MTIVNAYIAYDKPTQKKLFHLDFQAFSYYVVIVVKNLISNYDNCRRNPETSRTTRRLSRNFPTKSPSHLLDLKPSRCKCPYCKCKNQGKENRTFVKCNTCGVFLCLADSTSDRNCFYKHHLKALMKLICCV